VPAVYALYSNPDAAQRAVNKLRSRGVANRDIVVISSEPYEEYEFSHRDKHTWMFWIAGAGGAIGLLFGTFLTSYTQRAWPIPTGGMPIVAWWPNIVVMFELTFLGAILAAVGTLVVTAGLGRRRPNLYDSEVVDGQILVGVPQSSVSADVVHRALSAIEGARLKTI
jgi:Alternative complex III, ActD subunit